MLFSKTYFKDSFTGYLKILIITSITFFFIVFWFDLLELLRIAPKYSLKFFMIMKLALMKNYNTTSKIIPLLVLISAILFFYIKNKNNEIIIAKNLGISSIGILLPIILATFLFGIINIIVMNPIGTMLLRKYQNYEAYNFKKQISLVSVSKSGIWLKSKLEEDSIIINALRVSQISNTMYNTNIFFINKLGTLQKRVSAQSILFQDNDIIVKDALIINQDFTTNAEKEMILPIKISLSQILDNLASIETISFFQLLEFIKVTRESGLSTTKYQLHFLKEILSPFLLISMAVISYFYCCNIVQRKKFDISLLLCIVTGFIMYFIASFIHTLGASGKISIFLAAIFPIITFNLFSIYLVLHKNY